MSINRPLHDMAGKSYDVRDEDAAHAASILYNSFNSSGHMNDNNMSHMIAPPPVEVMEDPHVTKCCRMSAVRRTFCLVVLFDLVLTFILWLLYTELALAEAFKDEVLNYDFQKSMFDIVWMATARFFILILSYALYRSRTPWFVAVSTFLTCVYVLVKLFLYHWTTTTSPTTPPLVATFTGTTEAPAVNKTLQYLIIIFLVLSSLVLAWVEVWLLDFKVLPLEQRARERASLIHHTNYNERTPLLHDQRRLHPHDYQSDNFYSPYESRAGSDDEDEKYKSVRGSRGHSRNTSGVDMVYTPQEKEYIRTSKEAMDIAWRLLKQNDIWKGNSGDVEKGIVSTTQVPNLGKVFKLAGCIDMPPRDVFEEIVFNFENQLSWNNTVIAAEIIQQVNESTDVTYNVAAEAMGGMVSTRDFVNVRHWTKREGTYVMAGVAGEHPAKPVFKEHVRAENKTGAWFARPYEGDQNKTDFIWIMNVNLKGWLPQSLIDQALSSVMKDFLKALQARCVQIKTERLGNS